MERAQSGITNQQLDGRFVFEARVPLDEIASPASRNSTGAQPAGDSPSRLLQNRLSLAARRLLRDESLSVAGIDREPGFADAAYFSRFFQKHTGRTPLEFRKASAART
ncbi:MAG: helix-turn-helix domain-containing protein [Leptospirales bacterium]